MTTAYYGSDLTAGTGNWNTASNWYSSPGGVTSKGSPTPGTPLGRVPNSTDNIIIYNGTVSTGPTGGYTTSGTFSIGAGSTRIGYTTYPAVISAGTYNLPLLSFGVSSNSQNGVADISGTAVFNCPVNFNSSELYSSFYSSPWISGSAIINGNVTANAMVLRNIYSTAQTLLYMPLIDGNAIINGNITHSGIIFAGSCIINGSITPTQPGVLSRVNGLITLGIYVLEVPAGVYVYGTPAYNPPVTITYNSPTSVTISPQVQDPGFVAAGGTYAPVETLVGFPSGGASGFFIQ